MNIFRWSISCVFAVIVVAGCSPKDKDDANKAVQSIEDKTKEVAADAGDKAKQVASDVADKSKEVLSKTGEVITDGWITAKVKAKFADEKALKDTNVTVETKDRMVTLKGTLPSDAAKKRAGEIANGTEGVLSVSNEIVVKAK